MYNTYREEYAMHCRTTRHRDMQDLVLMSNSCGYSWVLEHALGAFFTRTMVIEGHGVVYSPSFLDRHFLRFFLLPRSLPLISDHPMQHPYRLRFSTSEYRSQRMNLSRMTQSRLYKKALQCAYASGLAAGGRLALGVSDDPKGLSISVLRDVGLTGTQHKKEVGCLSHSTSQGRDMGELSLFGLRRTGGLLNK